MRGAPSRACAGEVGGLQPLALSRAVLVQRLALPVHCLGVADPGGQRGARGPTCPPRRLARGGRQPRGGGRHHDALVPTEVLSRHRSQHGRPCPFVTRASEQHIRPIRGQQQSRAALHNHRIAHQRPRRATLTAAAAATAIAGNASLCSGTADRAGGRRWGEEATSHELRTRQRGYALLHRTSRTGTALCRIVTAASARQLPPAGTWSHCSRAGTAASLTAGRLSPPPSRPPTTLPRAPAGSRAAQGCCAARTGGQAHLDSADLRRPRRRAAAAFSTATWRRHCR